MQVLTRKELTELSDDLVKTEVDRQMVMDAIGGDDVVGIEALKARLVPDRMDARTFFHAIHWLQQDGAIGVEATPR